MSLQRLSLPVEPAPPLPSSVALYLSEATRRIEQFQYENCIPGFGPCQFAAVYQVLKILAGCSQLRGRRFCEWGSGFGVVAGLAAMLNYEAVGIEQEPLLVEQAQKLAEDFALPVSFVCGSFLPDELQTTTDGDLSAYDYLGLAPHEFDVIFAYPWPDERTQTLALFDELAGPGALFVMFHENDIVSVQKKIKPKKGK